MEGEGSSAVSPIAPSGPQGVSENDPNARVYRVYWFVPAFGLVAFIVFAYYLAAGLDLAPSIVFVERPPTRDLISSVILMPLCVYLVEMRRVLVVLDTVGIHRKGFHNWRSVQWSDVLSVRRRGFAYIVELKNGTRATVPGLVSCGTRAIGVDLPEYLERFAVSATHGFAPVSQRTQP